MSNAAFINTLPYIGYRPNAKTLYAGADSGYGDYRTLAAALNAASNGDRVIALPPATGASLGNITIPTGIGGLTIEGVIPTWTGIYDRAGIAENYTSIGSMLLAPSDADTFIKLKNLSITFLQITPSTTGRHLTLVIENCVINAWTKTNTNQLSSVNIINSFVNGMGGSALNCDWVYILNSVILSSTLNGLQFLHIRNSDMWRQTGNYFALSTDCNGQDPCCLFDGVKWVNKNINTTGDFCYFVGANNKSIHIRRNTYDAEVEGAYPTYTGYYPAVIYETDNNGTATLNIDSPYAPSTLAGTGIVCNFWPDQTPA